MKKLTHFLVPVLLFALIVASIGWYLFIYDREFTRDSHTSVVYQTVYRLRVELIGFAEVYFLYSLLAHSLKELRIRYRHLHSSFVPLSIHQHNRFVNVMCTKKYTNTMYHLWYIRQ